MKTNFKSMMMAALALIMGFASCSNDDENEKGDPVEGGISAKMSLVITQPTTYAADANATPGEVAIEKVDVFIYKVEGGIETFEKHQALVIADFTAGPANSNTWILNPASKITTTTGAKSIYVGVNLPVAVANKVITDGPATGVHSITTISELNSAANGFAMFSRNATLKTLDADEAQNTVTTSVARLLAKVVVKKDLDLTLDIAGGVISNLEFAVSNINKKIFALPDNVTFQDPNWTSPWTNLADFFSAVIGDYKVVNESTATIVNSNGVYATENTSQGIHESDNTYASIRGQFIPTNIVKLSVPGDGTSPLEADAAIVSGTTFYLVTANGMRYYFSNLADATAYEATNAGVMVTYTNGWTYYNVYLNPTPTPGNGSKFDVLRNKIYIVNITKINGLGVGEDGSGAGEIDEPTNIFVTLDIEQWSISVQDSELQ